MRTVPIFLFFSLFSAVCLRAGDTLTVEQVRALALQTSPLQQKKALAASAAALQLENIRSNNLPRIQLGAQATWQSDVFGLPIDNPAFQIPQVPKDQYKLSADVSERLWDGGADRYLRRQRELERDLTVAQTDVDVFQLRETVTGLFFNTLLLQENEAILAAALEQLRARLRQAEAAVSGGVSLRTNADQVKIQILQTEQQIASVRADQQTLKSILATWIGRENVDFSLRMTNPSRHSPGFPPKTWGQQPAIPNHQSPILRPEYQLFDLQKNNLQLGQDMLRLQMQPRVELFAQGGFGRPNPFNFFETGLKPFALVGLRAVWTPIDWGKRNRDRQVLGLQMQSLDAQRQAFDQRLTAITQKDQADQAKAQALLAQDDDMIALQEDIVQRAEAQVQNGVMTTTDYLAQLNLLTQIRLTRKTHEIQALQAQEMLNAKTGQE